jgi:hypothetical protein
MANIIDDLFQWAAQQPAGNIITVRKPLRRTRLPETTSSPMLPRGFQYPCGVGRFLPSPAARESSQLQAQADPDDR